MKRRNIDDFDSEQVEGSAHAGNIDPCQLLNGVRLSRESCAGGRTKGNDGAKNTCDSSSLNSKEPSFIEYAS